MVKELHAPFAICWYQRTGEINCSEPQCIPQGVGGEQDEGYPCASNAYSVCLSQRIKDKIDNGVTPICIKACDVWASLLCGESLTVTLT